MNSEHPDVRSTHSRGMHNSLYTAFRFFLEGVAMPVRLYGTWLDQIADSTFRHQSVEPRLANLVSQRNTK